MDPVALRLPPRAKVFNSLYVDADLECLTQDLLSVELPNGIFIDVGWYPEHDPSGCYCIRTYYRDWSNQQTRMEQTKELGEVVRIVEGLALWLGALKIG